MAAPKKTKVYCAGPMFSNADKWEMQNISDALEAAGFDTYLPSATASRWGASWRWATTRRPPRSRLRRSPS